MKPIPTLTPEQLERFWSYVDKSGECWEWTSYAHVRGYGHFSINGEIFRVNRISLALAKGDPGDLNVNHTCDNPACVNPAHLWAGTQQAGMIDKVTKGRQTKDETNVRQICIS